MKKRILLLTGLLVLCIAGQILLKSHVNVYADTDKLDHILADDEALQSAATSDLLKEDRVGEGRDALQRDLIYKFILILAFVAIVGAGAWLFCKKLSGTLGAARTRNMHVKETIHLGPRKLLHLVQVGSRQYLIGSTNESIRLLSEIAEDLKETDQ